jgi:lysophospholipase L1-like esterase
MKIIIFGDSIAHGAWDTKEGGWVQKFKNFLDEESLSESENEYTIYNLGVSGNTTEDLLERFEFETKQRLKGDEEELLFIFAIGINDTQFLHSKNNLRFTSEEYRDNLEKLLKTAKRFSQNIIFLGLTPVDESKTTPIPWNTDKSYKNEYIKEFNDVLEKFCRENKVYFIDVLNIFMKGNYNNLLEDGLHPNSEGHKKIFELIKSFLSENEIINYAPNNF